MKHYSWRRLGVATVLAAAACVGGAMSAAATPPSAAAVASPDAAATTYLQARAAAVTAAHPASSLARWLVPGSALAGDELLVARGTARRARQLGHNILATRCDVDITGTSLSADGTAATVTAHTVAATTWTAGSGARDSEATGLDHAIGLELIGDEWRVVTDAYSDVQRPSYLEAAGASPARVHRAERSMERVAEASRPSPPRHALGTAPERRRYHAIIRYDRAAAKAYADRYALSYNPTFVRFSADCANFASQCARAGHMPEVGSSYYSGWWYDKNGTSSPSNDTYSMSWINVPRQMGFWDGRRTEWASSIGSLARGDFVYYDWTGNGTWDHVAIVVGTNSAGQKIIDAHTTDHYHVFWKLGTAGTRYKFAKVRTSWIV